jgi:aminoglycoside phosphotransferase (APT) family kinase protein
VEDESPVPIDTRLVRALLADQFPQWAGLPVRPVRPQGWDNRTFRLGDELSVRLPSAVRYAEQPAKEQRWLPVLAARLPVAVPQPVAAGLPGRGYTWRWTVLRWLPGATPGAADAGRSEHFAQELAGFLVALRAVPAADGPPPGPHNFFRGGPPGYYADQVHEALHALGDGVDGPGAAAVWRAAEQASPGTGQPVWIHGDVAAGNLLTGGGRLTAVIDFGGCAVGDPACDAVPAWTLFSGAARSRFREELGLDDGTWARARGWALWKALVQLAAAPQGPDAEGHRQVVADVTAEHRELGDGSD